MARPKKERPQARGRRRRRGRARQHAAGARPVPLYKRSSSHFQTGDRERGSEYFRDGRVRVKIDGTRARAHVEGRQRSYGVGLDWSRVAATRALHAFCECQRFAEGRPCKHLWATLLAVAENGPDVHPPGKDRVGLRKDRASRWRDLGITVPDGAAQERTAPSRGPSGRRSQRPSRGRRPARSGAKADSWRSQLAALREQVDKLVGAAESEAAASPGLGERGIRFLVNTAASLDTSGLVLDVFAVRGPAGEGSARLQRTSLDAEDVERLLRPMNDPEAPGETVAVITALPADPPARKGRGRRGPRRSSQATVRRLRLPPELYDPVLAFLCAEDALGWWDGRTRGDLHSLSWDEGAAWQLVLRLVVSAGKARLTGSLERDSESVPLSEPVLILPGAGAVDGGGADGPGPRAPAVVLFAETVARLESVRERDVPWIELLREAGEIVIARDELAEALTALFEIPGLPRIEVPEELHLTEERSPLRPRLILESDLGSVLADPPLLARLSFTYGDLEVSAEDPRPSLIDWPQRTFLRRDMDGEHRALVRLLEAGVRPVAFGEGHELELGAKEMPPVAEALLADGWEVEVRGTSLRTPGPPALRVESGIDWFELSGSTDFAGDRVELRSILEAVSRGDRFVPLADGAQGLLPASWMETYDSLAKLAHESTDDGLRFLPSQALLVDAQLQAMPPEVDRGFAELRQKLRTFDRIKPKKEPRGFGGTLRGYQRDGLGWLGFLREFGLGGVLADDMGLGKTVQVLALLRANRTPSKTTGLPSLVVAPRSLVYNWIEESNRFTPTLSVVEYRGPDREELQGRFAEYDIVVTTYATLRRDIAFLATVEFDTVILDEAQAIKNRESQSAKASRLLVARNRLALTGTPIENHLGELGSIFEFLNPGLLGNMPRLDVLSGGRNASQKELEVVAAGMRPFILRRTKAQVLKDLPPKTEQVLYCTLTPSQRELYDKLRAGYQASLLGDVEAKGMSRSTIQVLEALLRLRQIACHPGLVDTDWEDSGSAKLEALFEHVSEVLDEGHKLIVFSQFTKLLAYVRRHLDDEEVPYAYLDGQTRDRGEVVERFQTDAACNIFLISLKAGGVGLNLTAAGYVFLLDPWWNPAVEAQAIDRAHRIGQTQPVFSYRLIARETVEERILELQNSKRQLADALLEGGGLPLSELTAEDLRMLLS